MRRRLTLMAMAIGALLTASCSDDDGSTTFPSMWNEIVCLTTDGQGRINRLLTDEGKSYMVTNNITGRTPNVAYRMMCGYTIDGQRATLYQMIGVHILRDSTACAAHDPLKAIAVWKSGPYINLHLAPLTQGGNHSWGFVTDSIGTDGHRYLSLHHRQNGDPLSYTQETYASIPLEELDNMAGGDSITLSIHTFKGIKTWNFKR